MPISEAGINFKTSPSGLIVPTTADNSGLGAVDVTHEWAGGIFQAPAASDPGGLSSGDAGYMYFNTSDNLMHLWDGSAWYTLDMTVDAGGLTFMQYLQANRSSLIGLWDFGAPASMPVPEIVTGTSARFFANSGSSWTMQQSTGWVGQASCATCANSGNGANISSSGGADPYAFALGAPFTYEIMFKLDAVNATFDLMGPDSNTSGGLTIRYDNPAGKWQAVKNYISVPVVGSATPDTGWHILAATIDSSNQWSLYLDGVQDGSTSSAITPVSPTFSAGLDVLWCNHANAIAAGKVGYVAIYNTALSGAELADNYDKALNGT